MTLKSFNDFHNEYNAENKATSIIKIQSICSGVDIFLKDCAFQSDIGKLDLHPIKGTHWDAYLAKFFFIHMVVHFLKKYLGLFQNEMGIVDIVNTKSKV